MLDDTLDCAIREYEPTDGNWLDLERYFALVFSTSDPTIYYHAIFNLFERFPDDDGAGVFWSALHGMESVGGYEEILLQYFRRLPSLMTRTMLKRMINGGETQIGGITIASLLTQ
jgi:hypothetical protein